MRVFRNPFRAGHWAPGSVAAIGKFDGLHLGHRRVIRLAVRRATRLATKCLVVTFDPHPRELFEPGAHQALLAPRERLRLLKRMGVDAVLLLPFDRKLACMAPEAFGRDILAAALKVMDVFVGQDFCFGKDRSGRVDDLSEYGRRYGFLVHAVPLALRQGEKVSSSRIRKLLAERRLREARALLGR